MVITKIVRSRKERGCFAVYVDDTLACLVSEEVLARFGLRGGGEIDEKSMEQLSSAAATDRARRIAINFLSYRPRSSREIIDKLTREGIPADVANNVAQHLRDIKMVNDLEFARMFVRDKLRGKPMGKAMMKQKLLAKGIAFQIIERVLKEYITEEAEQQAAARLAEKKLKVSRARFAGLDSARRQKRLVDYLLNRGFSTEIAMKTVRNIIS